MATIRLIGTHNTTMYNESKHLSKTGALLIQGYEKCVLTAYKDSAGIPTIAWGNTFYADGKPVKMGDKVTPAEADALFELIIPKFEQSIRPLIKRELLQNEWDAAVSFRYNAGTSYKGKDGQWHPFNLWHNITAGLHGKPMEDYWTTLAVTAGGKKLDGLVRRRRSEVMMYNKGVLNFFE